MTVLFQHVFFVIYFGQGLLHLSSLWVFSERCKSSNAHKCAQHMPKYGKENFVSLRQKNNTILSKWIPQLKKTLIGVLFMIEARPGHASWSYLRKDSTLPILNQDVNWWTDSDKTSTEKIIDKFIALSTRKDINIEISRNISSIYRKATLLLFKLVMIDFYVIVLETLSLYLSLKKS